MGSQTPSRRRMRCASTLRRRRSSIPKSRPSPSPIWRGVTRRCARAFAQKLAELSERCGLPRRLRDVGIPEDALARLASDAMNRTGLLVNNPRPLSEADAPAIYQAAW